MGCRLGKIVPLESSKPVASAVPTSSIAIAPRAIAPVATNVPCIKLNAFKAAKNNDVETLTQMHLQKADLNLRGMWQSTPLIYACQYGRSDAACFLITIAQVQVDVFNERGASALLLACLEGLTNVVSVILSNGGNTLVSLSSIGVVYNPFLDTNGSYTPLLAAVTNGSLLIVEMLLKNTSVDVINGCCPKKEVITDASSSEVVLLDGTTVAVVAAVQYGHLEILETLFSHNAHLQWKDAFNRNLFLMACHNKQEQIALFFVQQPTCRYMLLEVDTNGYSALHFCAQFGMIHLCTELFKNVKVWSIDVQDVHAHASPLFIACSHAQLEITTLLLQMGADPMLTNAAGETCFDIARQSQGDELLQILESTKSQKLIS